MTKTQLRLWTLKAIINEHIRKMRNERRNILRRKNISPTDYARANWLQTESNVLRAYVKGAMAAR